MASARRWIRQSMGESLTCFSMGDILRRVPLCIEPIGGIGIDQDGMRTIYV